MAEEVLKYADYFPPGMRVEVEIPLAEGHLLRDDARIVSADRDLLELHLSRHISPESAILEMGTDLFVRTGKEREGYRCRAIFLRCDDLCRLHVRLAGEVVPCDEREFFRVDVFIPLSYHPYSGHGREMMREERTGADRMKPFPVAANLSGAGVRINIT